SGRTSCGRRPFGWGTGAAAGGILQAVCSLRVRMVATHQRGLRGMVETGSEGRMGTTAKPEWAQSKRDKENVARAAEGLPPRRRRWPWVLLVLVVAAIAAAILLRPPAPVEPEETAAAAEPVMQINPSEITTVAPQVLQRTIKVTGSLAPARQTEVTSQLAGRIISVAVQPGERVVQGDVLVQIDTESLEIQLRQQRATAEATRAQLVSADRQLERTEELFEERLAPSSTLEQARSSAEALR